MYICPYIFTGPGKTSIITMEIQAGTVRLGRTFIMKLSSDLNQTMARFHQLLDVQTNFDIVYQMCIRDRYSRDGSRVSLMPSHPYLLRSQ